MWMWGTPLSVAEQRRRAMNPQSEDDLKVLEQRLRAAYFAKVNKCLITEKEASRLQQKEKEKIADEYEQKSNNFYMLAEKEKQVEKKKTNLTYRENLLQQIAEKCKMEQESKLRDKNVSHVIMPIITDEEEILRERQQKYEKQRKTKELLDNCLKSKQHFIYAQCISEMEEDRKILEIQKQRETDQQKTKEIAKILREEKEKALVDAAIVWSIEKNKDLERRNLVEDLLEIEKRMEEQRKYQEVEHRQKLTKVELNKIMQDQIKQKSLKSLLNEESRKLENQWIQEHIEKEKQKIKEIEERKRIKRTEYNKELHECLMQNKKRQVEEIRAKLEEQKREHDQFEKRLRGLEAERLQILSKHLPKLERIPPGVLKASDIPFLETEYIYK